MATEFGKFLRVVRAKCGDSAKVMAKKLNISPSYLSAIENGKRNIPAGLDKVLIEAYSLLEKDKEQLHKAMAKSSNRVKIDLAELDENKRKMILEITNGNLDEAVIKELHQILGTKDYAKNS